MAIRLGSVLARQRAPRAAPRATEPQRRVILLGASNVTRAFPTIVSTLRQTWDEPLDIMTAIGHGRSYGQDSSVLGRKISGIFPCALWQDLQSRTPLPTAALITDIGNDLLHGISPHELLAWVENCLDRLQAVDANIAVTRLPIESIDALSERRFYFFRRLLFPRSKLTLNEARRHVRTLNEQLTRLEETRKISVIPVSHAWYGFDPIHLRKRVLRQAWPTILASWRATDEPLIAPRTSARARLYLASRAPLERAIFGIPLRAAQPNAHFSDGTRISLY